MDNEIKSWLYDILNAIMEIESFLAGQPKDFEKYKADLRTKRAVERNIGIIGEATNRILKKNTAIAITSSRKIVDVRNRISHGYDSVSDEFICSIIVRHIPILKAEVEKLLDE